MVVSCSRCVRRHGAVERELHHPEHAVHRRPDLVAHVGEEVALGAAGVLGAILGLGELRGALGDLLLEVLLVPLEVEVARLDLRQHVVEGADQDAQLLDVRVLLDAQAVVARRRDTLGRRRELLDRQRDRPLQPMAEAAASASETTNTTLVMLTVRQTRASSCVQVRADEHPSDRLAVERHVADDREIARGRWAASDRPRASAVSSRQAWRRRRARCPEARVERRRLHVGARRQRLQRLARGGAVAEGERRGAVVCRPDRRAPRGRGSAPGDRWRCRRRRAPPPRGPGPRRS